MSHPFEVPAAEIAANLDHYIDDVFASLRSGFLTMPKGDGFVEYPVFETGYEALKRTTRDFRVLDPEEVFATILATPVSFIVLRTMLGFTPPEWAYVTQERTNVPVPQGAIRTLDRKVRLAPTTRLRASGGLEERRIRALVRTACELLTEGIPETPPALIHRLDKADTRDGLRSIQPLADLGVPYAMLLYERFLGRPFAAHRDSVSELVGDAVEAAVEAALTAPRISFRKTGRAERVQGFDQAPDFVVPNEFNPQLVIEAKLTEDDGTARDKVTRIQHLASLAMRDRTEAQGPRFEVVACIAGRGFKVRRADMAKLLLATRGKVFTLETISQMVKHTRLAEFVSRDDSQS
jgi:hypothetical protein